MRELRKRLGVAGECRQQQDRNVAPIRVIATGEPLSATG
jgi:hypothetical protein